MRKKAISTFIKTSELYLKLTERNRSATNITEIDNLLILDPPEVFRFSNNVSNNERRVDRSA